MNFEYALTYFLSKKNRMSDVCLVDLKRKVLYGGYKENEEYRNEEMLMTDKQIQFHLKIDQMIPLTKCQFNKFLNFTSNAFENKDKTKTFARFGLIEWLI